MVEQELKKLILEKYKSVREFATIISLPYTTVDSILKRGVEKANIINIIKICDQLDIDVDELAKGNIAQRSKQGDNIELSENECNHVKKYRELDVHGKDIVSTVLRMEHRRCMEASAPAVRKIKIKFSNIPASAGSGAFLDEQNIEEREFPKTPESSQADIVIPVEGDSMEPMFFNGDQLYVKLQSSVKLGEIGIFEKGDKAFVKKLGSDRLISINSQYDDIFPDSSETITCVGKVIGKVEY